MKQLRNNFMQPESPSGNIPGYFPPPKGKIPNALAPVSAKNGS